MDPCRLCRLCLPDPSRRPLNNCRQPSAGCLELQGRGNHPNIANVLDAGATHAGWTHFVIELGRGIRITDYWDQNNLSTNQRLDLSIQISLTIRRVHEECFIHREIKSSSILAPCFERLFARAQGDLFCHREGRRSAPCRQSADHPVRANHRHALLCQPRSVRLLKSCGPARLLVQRRDKGGRRSSSEQLVLFRKPLNRLASEFRMYR
jgi:serine/threonine protein kinase